MALVAYDYESESDNEEEQEESASSVVIIPEKKETRKAVTTNNHIPENNDLPEILSHLPKSQPTESAKNVVDDKLEDFIPKYKPSEQKERKKVKISIPSLAQFEADDDDDDEPKDKKIKSVKGSTLLSMLPPVKGSPLSTKSFVPNVLKNKPPPKEKSKNPLVPHAVRKKAELAKMATIRKIAKASQSVSDTESDDDFEMPETFDDETWLKVCGRKVKPKTVVQPVDTPVMKPIDIAPEPSQPYDGLDNEAFKELVGKSKRPVNIKLVDINEEEILPDKNLWLTKSLTDPDQAPEPVIDEPVDPTRRKKHHITYLAEQAKANEQKLAAEWSASKHNRNQTRAKYGF